MRKRLRAVAAACFRSSLFAVVAACATPEPLPRPSPAPAPAASPDDALDSRCEGGPGGGGFGVTVRRSGDIVRWHTPSFHEEPEEFPIGTDAKLAAELFAEADEIGFASIVYSEKGNMTCALRADAAGTMHEVSWPIGSRDAPGRVVSLADRIRALVSTAPVTTLEE